MVCEVALLGPEGLSTLIGKVSAHGRLKSNEKCLHGTGTMKVSACSKQVFAYGTFNAPVRRGSTVTNSGTISSTVYLSTFLQSNV